MTQQWHVLKPACRKCDGRKRVTVKRDDGTYRRAYVSTFMLESFVGPRPAGMEACHNDGDCTNDRRTNLRWDTPTANKADMLRHGTRLMGENHPSAKLSDRHVASILAMRAGGDSIPMIAYRFNVTPQRVHQITKKGRR